MGHAMARQQSTIGGLGALQNPAGRGPSMTKMSYSASPNLKTLKIGGLVLLYSVALSLQ